MKVFGVGFQRTGLTSLTNAMNVLGVKTIQYPTQLYADPDDPVLQEFQGFTDNPIPFLYTKLDAKCPRSKFILTVREERDWLASVEWLFRVGSVKFRWDVLEFSDEFHQRLYGTTRYDPSVFLQKYREHNENVRTYFEHRPDDFIELDITKGDGFEKLCGFLDRPLPVGLFPHYNKREGIMEVRLRRLLRNIKYKSTALMKKG